MTRVYVDRHAGFCSGVKRALRGARRAVAQGGAVVSYGELIHNPEVTGALEKEGIAVRLALADISAGQRVIVRAHGISPVEERELRERGCAILDFTCPRVKEIHRIIGSRGAQGCRVLIVGDRNHPEVRGHLGYAGEGRGWAVSSTLEAEALAQKLAAEEPRSPLLVLAQTTTTPELVQEVIASFHRGGLKPEALDTLCPFVRRRQEWIRRMAGRTAAALIIGGRNSSNTYKLFEIASEYGPAWWIQNHREADFKLLLDRPELAVTAGASTPDETIVEIASELENRGARVIRS